MATKRDQATATPPSDGGEWEDIRIGIGDEWDFANGPLIGAFIGSVERDIDGRSQLVHQFAPEGDEDNVAFLWGSYQLDTAFEKINAGTRCRIQYLGIRSFTSSDGPRQVKNYRVQVAR